MKPIYYGLLCEDNSHQLFIKALMSQLPAKSKIQKIKVLKFSYKKDVEHQIKARTKSEVIKRCGEAASFAFGKNGLHLLLVGVDCDEEWKEKDLDVHKNNILNKIDKDFRKNAVVFLPVKCVEHWLLYLKLLKENPSLKSSKKLESKSNDEAKKAVYGKKKVPKVLQERVIAELCDDINLNWLITQSNSFKHFHDQLQTFMKTF